MRAFKYCLQVMLVVAWMAADDVMSVRDNFQSHKSSPLLFPRHLIGSGKGHNMEGIHGVKTYLQRYGYLMSNNLGTNGVHVDAFDDDLETAVKSYQRFFKLNVSGILDAKTLHLMSQPRCGIPDMFYDNNNNNNNETISGGVSTKYAFFPGRPKWPKNRMNLRYAFINDFKDEFKYPVGDAFMLWSGYSSFVFTEAEDEYSADIKVSFETGDHGDGHAFKKGSGVLAHAFGPTDGRLHYNGDQSFSDGALEGAYDVMTVALHEIGHVIGLAHSSTEEAIMWPTITSNFIKGLYQDDIDGVTELYGIGA